MKKIYAIFLVSGLLFGCADVEKITVEGRSVEVNASVDSSAGIDGLIGPYRDSMNAQMDVVIAYASDDFVKGRPHGALNNWSADAIFNYEMRTNVGTEYPGPYMCLLNVGGLRNPLSEGDITIGDVYKLMPFDNEVVWVEMPWESSVDIANYLVKRGGEPIAGAELIGDSLIFDGIQEPMETFWVITSDYLMNGGDKMTFFEQKISSSYSGVLMRDVMIEEASLQDTLDFDDEPRIKL